MNYQESTSDLNTEPNTAGIYKAGLFLLRKHIFRHVDSMIEKHELIVSMRMPACLYVELVS